MEPKNITVLIVIVLSLIILIQNTYIVTLRLFFWKLDMSPF
jgi:uncharacterized integral membrane protein